MGIEFEFFEAGKGDSILISTSEGTNILIDGGVIKEYNKNLKKSIAKNIREKGKVLDLVVLTHYDADHIGGILKLLQEETKNIKSHQEIIIKEIWFNSFYKDIVDIEVGKTTSGKQQVKLDEYIEKMSVNSNLSYSNSISISKIKKPIYIGKNREVKLTLLSPNDEKLLNLKKDYEQAYLDYHAKNKKTSSGNDYHLSFEQLLEDKMSKKDKTVANGSSIAFILEYCSKKYLFLGDAHIDLIMESLENLNENLKFEFVKLSHHGSIKNLHKNFVKLIETDTYVILTNGSHGHPNKETIAKIFTYRKDENKAVNLICNYKKVEEILKSFITHEKYNVFLEKSIRFR